MPEINPPIDSRKYNPEHQSTMSRAIGRYLLIRSILVTHHVGYYFSVCDIWFWLNKSFDIR
jgi:hypothetical protein